MAPDTPSPDKASPPVPPPAGDGGGASVGSAIGATAGAGTGTVTAVDPAPGGVVRPAAAGSGTGGVGVASVPGGAAPAGGSSGASESNLGGAASASGGEDRHGGAKHDAVDKETSWIGLATFTAASSESTRRTTDAGALGNKLWECNRWRRLMAVFSAARVGAPWTLERDDESDKVMDKIWWRIASATCEGVASKGSTACFLLLGQKGCGKTSRLRMLAAARCLTHPTAVTVFACMRLTHPQPTTLRKLVWDAFVKLYPSYGEQDMPETIMDVGVTVVVETRCPVLLVLDEIHDVYRYRDGHGRDIIQELAAIGGDVRDLFVVVVAGSAAATRDLAFCALPESDSVLAYWPSYQAGRSLNHTKFPPLQLSPLPRRIVDTMVDASLDKIVEAAVERKRDAPDEEKERTRQSMQSRANALRELVREQVFLSCGGNGRIVFQHTEKHFEGVTAEAFDLEASYEPVLHEALRDAVLATPEVTDWPSYVDGLVQGDDPVFVSVEALMAKLPPAYTPPIAESPTRQCWWWADHGRLTAKQASEGGLVVTFANPWQAARATRGYDHVPSAGASTLTTYDRICVRFPYGKLGQDAEDIVARSLVRAAQDSGDSESSSAIDDVAVHACRAATQLSGAGGRTVQLLSCPLVGGTKPTEEHYKYFTGLPAIRAKAVLGCAVGKHLRMSPPAVSVFATLRDDRDSVRVLTFPERLAFLRGHAGTVFKEHPDVHGADLVWWTVDGQSVTVWRVQVKLGLSALDLTTTSQKLLTGWKCVRHLYSCGKSVSVNHKPVILTTRATTGACVGGVELWGRDVMLNVWEPSVVAFAWRMVLTAFVDMAGGDADAEDDDDLPVFEDGDDLGSVDSLDDYDG